MKLSTQRILVIGVARIGDTLLLTPTLRALKRRFPEASLSFRVHPGRREAVDHLPFVDRLDGITKKTAPFKGWLGLEKFDLALVYGSDLALLKYAARVSAAVYCFDYLEFKGLNNSKLRKIPVPETPCHAVAERFLLAAPLVGTLEERRLAYNVTEAERAQAKARLSSLGLEQRRPRIGLIPFSFPTKSHRDWPLDNFLALVERVLQHCPRANFLIFGDAVAAEKSILLKQRFSDAVTVVAGTTSLRQSAALMEQLDLYVGVDTGPTHLAGALGVPMVALYHHQYPGRFLQPLDHPACIVMEHPDTLSWHPSSLGMEALGVDGVLAHVLLMLEGRGFVQNA